MPNPTLRTMAIDQATYLSALTGLPGGQDGGDIHMDRLGQTPPQRAIKAPYNWPTYGLPARAAIGEIAAVGTVDYALYFWSTSDIHRKTALNAGYREVGVAAIPGKNGYLIIVDFGARPNVLPVFVDPVEHALYLTNEQYRYKSGGNWIHSATQIQFLADDDQPLHDASELWQQKLVIDSTWGSSFKVLYLDGTTKSTFPVDMPESDVILPRTPTPQSTVAASPTATVNSTATQPATNSSTGAAAAQPTNQPTLTLTPTVNPTATAALVQPADIVLLYDSESLTLLNKSKKPVNLTDFNFKYGDQYLGAARWSKVVSIPIAAFPSGQCLQLLVASKDPIKPENCSYLRSVLQFAPDYLFWTKSDFDVMIGTQDIATCQARIGRCEVVWNP